MSFQDTTQRFMFEHADVRGELVALDQSYREVLAKHDEEYMPAEVAEAVKGIKHEKPKYNLGSDY